MRSAQLLVKRRADARKVYLTGKVTLFTEKPASRPVVRVNNTPFLCPIRVVAKELYTKRRK